jgi:hypothetical protein
LSCSEVASESPSSEKAACLGIRDRSYGKRWIFSSTGQSVGSFRYLANRARRGEDCGPQSDRKNKEAHVTAAE